MHHKTILIGLDAAVPTLVERYMAEGHMPNLQKLLAAGAYSRLYSTIPGITPVAWASVSTGAHPGTHGITDFMILDEGEPLDAGRNAFLSTELQAETLWHAAEAAGLTAATIDFPQSWPCAGRTGYWVAGYGSPASGSPFEVRASSCFATPELAAGMRDATVVRWESGQVKFRLTPFRDPYGQGPVFRLEAGGSETLRLTGPDSTACLLQPGAWGPWLTATFVEHGHAVTGTFRFKLSRLSASHEFALYCSQVVALERMTEPAALAAELMQHAGPYIENDGARGYERQWIDLDTFCAEGEYKARWMGQAGRYLLAEKGVDLLLMKWHFLDHVQHLLWGQIDPISPWYDAADASRHAAALLRAYRAADELIGCFLPLLDQGYLVAVVSDHGHTPHLKAMSVNNLLAQSGLVHWSPGESRAIIDWSRTRAFGGPCCGQIRVNLKGRDPDGIVDPADFEQVQDEVIQLLLSYRDPDTGLPPVVAAVRKRDAKALGHWGPRTGDIVYLMREGYSGDFNWSPLSEDGQVLVPLHPGLVATADYGQYKFIASKFQSLHGCGFPSASLGMGTDECIFALAGPGVRAGYRRSVPAHLVDVAPTLAHFAGVPCPRHSEGNVVAVASHSVGAAAQG